MARQTAVAVAAELKLALSQAVAAAEGGGRHRRWVEGALLPQAEAVAVRAALVLLVEGEARELPMKRIVARGAAA